MDNQADSGSSAYICPDCGSENVHFSAKWSRYVCVDCVRIIEPRRQSRNELSAAVPIPRMVWFGACREEYLRNAEKLQSDICARGHCAVGDAATADFTLWFYPASDAHGDETPDMMRTPGRVLPVLLAPEAADDLPIRLRFIQPLDMSAWSELERDDPEAFKDWYQTRLAETLHAIEDGGGFEGEIASLRDKLAIDRGEPSFDFRLEDASIERPWLNSRVEGWLRRVDGTRVLTVQAGYGYGKTRYAALLCEHAPYVAAGLFCKWNQPHYASAEAVMRRLAFQLAARLSRYRTYLLELLEDTPDWGALKGVDLFDFLLSEPLEQAERNAAKPLVIVADGIDEAECDGENPVLEALSHMERLPGWLRLLAFSRKAEPVSEAFADMEIICADDAHEANFQESRAYFAQALANHRGSRGDAAWNAILDALAERCGGVMLYASFAAHLAREGDMDLDAPDRFPADLYEAFALAFKRRFRDVDQYKAMYRKPLSMTVSAPQSVPARLFERACGLSGDEARKLLERLSLCIERLRDGTVALRHQAYAAWLRRKSAMQYLVSRVDGGTALAEACYQAYEAGEADAYEARYLIRLLRLSNKWDELERVLCNARFIRQSIELSERALAGGEYALAQALTETGLIPLKRLNDARNTLESRQDYALALSVAGALYRSQSNITTALSYYEQSAAVRMDATAEPDAPEAQRELADTLEAASELCGQCGKRSRALMLCAQSLKIRRALTAAQDTPDTRLALAAALENEGGIMAEAGHFEDADRAYEECVDTRRALALDTPEGRRALAHVLCLRGRVLRRLGRGRDALPLFEEFLTIASQLARALRTLSARRELALAMRSVGEALCERGEHEKAQSFFEESLQIFRRLDEVSREPWARRDLAAGLRFAGDAKRAAGAFQEAGSLYAESQACICELLRISGTPRAWREYALTLAAIGALARAAGRTEEACRACAECVEIATRLDAQRNVTWTREDLANARTALGDARRDAGQAEAALECYCQALSLRRRLAEGEAAPDALFRLAETLGRVGDAYHDMAEYQRALASYQECRELWSGLVKAGTPEALDGLAETLRRMGDAQSNLDEPGEALVLYERCHEIRGQFAKALGTPEAWRDLASVLCDVGDAKRAVGDLEEALELLEEGRAIYQQTLTDSCISAQAWRRYAGALCGIGDIKTELGRQAEALDDYAEGLKLARKAAAMRDTPSDKQYLTVALEKYGDALAASGQADSALETHTECLSIARKLSAVRRTPETLRDLAGSLVRVGSLRQDRGDMREALKLYEECVEIARKLAQAQYEPQARRDLAAALALNGGILRDMGDLKAASAIWAEAREIYERLAEETGTPEAREELTRFLTDTGAEAPNLAEAVRYVEPCEADAELPNDGASNRNGVIAEIAAPATPAAEPRIAAMELPDDNASTPGGVPAEQDASSEQAVSNVPFEQIEQAVSAVFTAPADEPYITAAESPNCSAGTPGVTAEQAVPASSAALAAPADEPCITDAEPPDCNAGTPGVTAEQAVPASSAAPTAPADEPRTVAAEPPDCSASTPGVTVERAVTNAPVEQIEQAVSAAPTAPIAESRTAAAEPPDCSASAPGDVTAEPAMTNAPVEQIEQAVSAAATAPIADPRIAAAEPLCIGDATTPADMEIAPAASDEVRPRRRRYRGN